MFHLLKNGLGAIKGYLCQAQVDNSLDDTVEGLRGLHKSDQHYNRLARQDHQHRNFYQLSIFHIALRRFQRMFQLKLVFIEISSPGISLKGELVETLLSTLLVLRDLNIPIQVCNLSVKLFQNFCTFNSFHIDTKNTLFGIPASKLVAATIYWQVVNKGDIDLKTVLVSGLTGSTFRLSCFGIISWMARRLYFSDRWTSISSFTFSLDIHPHFVAVISLITSILNAFGTEMALP